MRLRSIVLLAGCTFCASSSPQSANRPNPAPPLIRAGTKEVVLDLVVRDKHGHLAKNLTAADVKVYEDGVEQSIKDFRELEGATPPPPQPPAANATAASKPRTPSEAAQFIREAKFVSIVMGQMALGNAPLAQEAALDFIHAQLPSDAFISVFRLDLNLQLVLPFTRNSDLLTAAIKRAATGLYKGIPAGAATTEASLHDALGGSSGLDTGPAVNLGQASFSSTVHDPTFASNASAQDASFGLNQGLASEALLVNRLRFSDTLVTGMYTLDALRELIRSQATLPARKIVIYLADGLTLPTGRADLLTGLVSDANRANVTFYGVDTRGLSLSAPGAESLTQLSRAAQEGRSRSHQSVDDLELAAVSNKELALRNLAEQTGGFAVVSTNEVNKPMQRVAEDLGTYYELTYSPTSGKYDGQFRKIEVKVEHASVETRKGYYALPDLNGEPLEPFEITALQALESRPLPASFAYSAELMHFKPDRDSVECAVAFDVPISSLKLAGDREHSKARIHASVLALVKDAGGNVLDKVSRDLYQEAPSGQLAAFRKERILYAEPVMLKPGHYNIDTAVVDEQAQKVAARRIAIFIPSADLALSSLEIVKRLDPLRGPRNLADPFEIANGRVTPTLANTVPSGKSLNLFFVVYPATKVSGSPKLTLQLIRDGKVISQSSPNLPKPDASGGISMSLQLSPPPGEYDVRVTAQQGVLMAQSDRIVTAE